MIDSLRKRLTATSDLISTSVVQSLKFVSVIGCFFEVTVTKIYYDDFTVKYINTMLANCVTDCVQNFLFFLGLNLYFLKTLLCKNLGVEKLLDFAGKRPWLQGRR